MYDNRDLNLMDVIIFKCLIMYVMKIFSSPQFWARDFKCLVSKFQQDITYYPGVQSVTTILFTTEKASKH